MLGGTTLNNGLLQVGNNSALGSGLVTLSGGSLSSASTTGYALANSMSFSTNTTLGDPTNNGALSFSGTVSLGGAARTLTINSPVTFAGAVSNGTLDSKVRDGQPHALCRQYLQPAPTSISLGTLALALAAAASPATA